MTQIIQYVDYQTAYIKSVLGEFTFDDLDESLPQKYLSGTDLSELDKKNLIKLISRVYGYTGFLSQKVLLAAVDAKIDSKELIDFIGWNQTQKAQEKISENLHNYDQLKKKANQVCGEAINKAISAAPSEFRLRKALELMQKVKSAAKIASSNYLSDESLTVAKNKIDQVEFETPRSSATIREQILKTLSSRTEQLESNRNAIEKAFKSDKQWKSVVVDTVAKTSGRSIEETVLDQIKLSCQEFEPKSFEDKALYSIGKIQMGWQSTLFGEFGAGVMAHEIGHIVSHAVANLPGNQGYLQARQCSSKTHLDLEGPSLSVDAATAYNEEDWADSFAATTIKILNESWPYSKNFACALVPVSEAESFDDLTLSIQSGLDSHSTGILRALKIHSELGGTIPTSCRVSYGSEKMAALENKCSK